MEIQYDDLVETIFSKEPDKPKSITLDFVNKLELKDLFEFLLSLFTDGCKRLFGKYENNILKVNLDDFSTEKIDKIKKYFLMIGFELIINIEKYNPDKDYELLNYNNKIIDDQTSLSELTMIIRRINTVYFVNFEFIR